MTEIMESRKISLDFLTVIASFLVVLLHQAAQVGSSSDIYIYISDSRRSCRSAFRYEKWRIAAVKIAANGIFVYRKSSC